MPLTIQNFEGDGVTDDRLQVTISLPDDQSSIAVEGMIIAAPGNGAPTLVAKQTLTSPTSPVSGLLYYNVQIDVGSGVAMIMTSTVVDPAPVANGAGFGGLQRIVFRQTLAPGQTSDTLAGGDSTPDPGLGAA